ncbi:metalloprotease TldD [Idiomarina xiamenensis]|uniref:Zn-dependent protease n=1 Tax=Idiomarina xiamenensis 10-D-4 TaxID=740709 RepID=K2KF59_9GAMM|nr:metalloprotease TldD [Idiomarina xiamenensis]EKE85387.1 Zn-dependent protease [Idiomarina xiamenensis 10-D-4]
MSNSQQVMQSLLTQHQLSTEQLQQSLAKVYSGAIDFADIYLQSSRNESWVLEDGIVKDGSFHIETGLGVRAVYGDKTGFAYADEISLAALETAAKAARGITQQGQQGKLKVLQSVTAEARYGAIDPLQTLTEAEKIQLLRDADQFARQLDARVSQVIVSLSGSYDDVLVAASDGTLATDSRPLVRMNCSVLVEHNGRRERGSSGGGARLGYRFFLQQDSKQQPRWQHYVKEAVRMALVNLEARPAPAGTMPVVLGAGWPGVLLHEAVGHGLEGDFNRKESSAYSGKIGEKVASSLCTIVDDGTLNDRRGSLSIDDEGTAAGYNVLIENGVLKGYMQDKLNARLMGMAATGNGRRESYAHLPMPRMTNTYMLAGESDPEEIIGSVKRGIYAPQFAGGQVDITSGKFVFSASEAYLIEDGKLTVPLKGATLIGNGPQAMSQVSMVGNDLALDEGVGVCGKDGQSVPVGVGQPTLKLDAMTVGGTE